MTSWEWTSPLDSLIGYQAKQAIWFSRNLVSSVNVRNPSRTECTQHCIAHSYSVYDKMAVGSESGKKQKKKQGHKDFWKKRSFELSGKNGSMLLNVGAGCGNVSDTHTKKHKSGGKKCVNLPYRVFSFRGLSKVKSMILCQHLERSIFRFWWIPASVCSVGCRC